MSNNKLNFVDRKGNKYQKGYVEGSIVDNKLSGVWFMVEIRRTALYVSPEKVTPMLDDMDRRRIYSLIRDSLFNGEKVLYKPNRRARKMILKD